MERDDDATLAGWHRDPSGRHELRFWDGTRWTEHVVSEGIPGHDHPTRSGRPPGETAASAVATPAPPPPPPVTAEEPAAEEPATAVGTTEDDEGSVDAMVDLVEIEEPPVEATVTPGRSARAGTVNPAPPPPEARPPAATASEAPTPDVPTPDVPTPDPPASDTPTPDAPAPDAPAPGRVPADPVRATLPRLVAEPPTVASPAGRSSGSNTSAIADPHRFEAGEAPRDRGQVAGVSPVPVKRYRPGSPPASPYVRPQALPSGGAPIGTVITPWYRKASGWLTLGLVTAIAACVVIVAIALADDGPSARLGGRPPAAAPAGTRVIDGNGFGIAAPQSWVVSTDPNSLFPALRTADWGTPLVASDPGAGQALVVVPLHHLAHDPQVDPELFWSDQVRDAATRRVPDPGPPLSVHGFRANQVSIALSGEPAVVAASIDTGDRTFLVAVSASTLSEAKEQFAGLIQTFDPR